VELHGVVAEVGSTDEAGCETGSISMAKVVERISRAARSDLVSRQRYPCTKGKCFTHAIETSLSEEVGRLRNFDEKARREGDVAGKFLAERDLEWE
jgi:hypothetical protein